MTKCARCGGQMIPIVHPGTLRRSDVVGCGHCDAPCTRVRCAMCAKINKTVRIIPPPT